jgi:hypothetical protein
MNASECESLIIVTTNVKDEEKKRKLKQLDLVQQRPFGSNHEIFVYASIEFGETSALFIQPNEKENEQKTQLFLFLIQSNTFSHFIQKVFPQRS